MDPSNVVFFAIVAAALWFGPRVILDSFGRTGNMISVLFVPPDWKLGWPHGVQEGDADWGWRTPAEAMTSTASSPGLDDDLAIPQVQELVDGSPSSWSHGDGLIVEPRLVQRS
ncbi:MAG TPA: hypothetical protein VH440_01890 [Candidatus Limnocylindrales bacterium]|jgi:hypothetical protein